MSTFTPGTPVSIEFEAAGCTCGCTRTARDNYRTVVVEAERKFRSDTVRVMGVNGKPISEFLRHVKPLADA